MRRAIWTGKMSFFVFSGFRWIISVEIVRLIHCTRSRVWFNVFYPGFLLLIVCFVVLFYKIELNVGKLNWSPVLLYFCFLHFFFATGFVYCAHCFVDIHSIFLLLIIISTDGYDSIESLVIRCGVVPPIKSEMRFHAFNIILRSHTISVIIRISHTCEMGLSVRKRGFCILDAVLMVPFYSHFCCSLGILAVSASLLIVMGILVTLFFHQIIDMFIYKVNHKLIMEKIRRSVLFFIKKI